MALKALKPRLAPVDTKAYGDNHRPKSRWGHGRGGRPWRRKRLAVLERDRFTCQTCHRVDTTLECDHIVPVSQGGSDDMSNLEAICVPCHQKKTHEESQAGKYGLTNQE